MSEGQTGPYDTIARRWLALVERRQEHFIELCGTGRWRHYYSRAEFLDEMRKVLRVRNQWATIAGLPVAEEHPLFGEYGAMPHGAELLPDDDYAAFRSNDLPSYQADYSPGVPAPAWPD
jgi:uncharacterized repeat protein (TIGR03809 family)